MQTPETMNLIKPIIFLCIPLFFQCNFSNKEDSEEVENKQEVVVDTTQYVRIVANNLRMRSSPSLDGTQIAQIPEGQIVPLTGMKSHEKESISIRGKNEPHYWYEIEYNQEIGWIYGGGMERVEMENAALAAINDFMIMAGERVGMITPEDSENTITQKYGAEHIQRMALDIGEGEKVMGNVLFPGSENEVKIFWENEDFTHLNSILISHPEGEWRTPEGIKIGMSISKVNEINDQTFQLMGFEWDYSGRVINWQGGKLSDHLKLYFEPEGDISVYPFLQGDKMIYSNNSSLIKVKPKVVKIEVTF